jgi:hypothetical protein
MILIPLLILQIFLLPFAASVMMNYWTTSSETITLRDAATHLGSSIQQLYLFINNPALSTTTVTNNLGVPTYINSYAYSGKVTLTSASGSEEILNLTLSLTGSTISTSSFVVLGQNARWNPNYATFMSNSPTACISANKYGNGTILLYFTT